MPRLTRGAFTQKHKSVKKATSQGVGGRSRRIKCSTGTMNKHKRRSYKKYRGQGRWWDKEFNIK